MHDTTFIKIENALITIAQRAADPRGNKQINERAGVDIERAEAVMLWRIGNLESPRLSELAQAAGVEMSSASRPVARLVDNGYVERMVDPTDGRASVHMLTPAGETILQQLIGARQDWLRVLLSDFDADEQRTFADLLHRFVQRITDESSARLV